MNKLQEALTSEYRIFSETEDTLPIYMKAWWLDAGCGVGKWSVSIYKKGDDIVGALCFSIGKKLGLSRIFTPPHAPYSGIWMRGSNKEKKHAILSEQTQIMNALIDGLPEALFTDLKLSPDTTDWLPFYHRGFKEVTCYTHVIPDITNPEELFKGFKNTVRTSIRNADEQFKIRKIDWQEFAQHYENLSSGKLNARIILKTLDNIQQELEARNLSYMIGAFNKDNQCQGVAFFFLDRDTVIYGPCAVNKSMSSNGSLYALVWQAIIHYSEKAQLFDFNGTMLEKVLPVFRSMCGEPLRYFKVTHSSTKWLEVIRGLRG